MNKLKIVLDSNTLNELAECSSEIIEILSQKCKLLNCNTLIRELENVKQSQPDLYSKSHSALKKFQSGMNFVFAFANSIKGVRNENTYGFLTKRDINKDINVKMLTSKAFKLYKSIHPNAVTPKKESDRQIAQIASLHNADLIVTNDRSFYNGLGNKVMKFNEFLNWILKK